MENEAEAFIIVPGGIGTFEEYFEVLTLKQLGRHDKALALYNLEGYYDELENFMLTVKKRKFMSFACSEMYSYFTSPSEIIEYIENYVPQKFDLSKLKTGE